MAEQKFILIVYDISNDKRRTKLHNLLLDFGTPVQYSVFECLLKPEAVIQLKSAVYRVIRKRIDSVRFYDLCADCVSRTEITCGREVFGPPPKTILV